MPFEMEQAKFLRPGLPVITSDGERLGEIKEVTDAFFKVNVKMRPDFWLQNEFIDTADSEKVVMQFTKDQADDYHVSHPDEAPVVQSADRPSVDSSPYPETSAAATITEAERREKLDA